MKPYAPISILLYGAALLSGCTAHVVDGPAPCDGSTWHGAGSRRCAHADRCPGASSTTSSAHGSAAATAGTTPSSASSPATATAPGRFRARHLRPARPGGAALGHRPKAPARSPATAPDLPSEPAAHGWDMLGASKLDLRGSQGSVAVTRKRGTYRTLRLHVGGTPLELRNVQVVFADGGSYTPGTVLSFQPGSYTHQIALPAPPRDVVRVDFSYAGTGRQTGNGTIRLFGQH